jgi:hypothetical protein
MNGASEGDRTLVCSMANCVNVLKLLTHVPDHEAQFRFSRRVE